MNTFLIGLVVENLKRDQILKLIIILIPVCKSWATLNHSYFYSSQRFKMPVPSNVGLPIYVQNFQNE